MTARDDAAGQRFRCLACGTIQTVPAGSDPLAKAEFARQATIEPPRRPRVPPPPEPVVETPLTPALVTRWYALSILHCFRNAGSLAVMLLGFVGAYCLFQLYAGVLSFLLMRNPLALTTFLVLVAAVQYVLLGYLTRYFLDTIVLTLSDVTKAPSLSAFAIRYLFVDGIRGLGILIVYVLPVVTLPLLPMGLLGMACADDGRALDLAWAWRAVRRMRREYARLWLVLGIWCAGAGGCALGVHFLTGKLFSAAMGRSGQMDASVAVIVWALGCLAASVGLLAFVAAFFRCIGIFGRCYDEPLEMLPERDDPRRTVVFVVAALAAAFGLRMGVIGPLLWIIGA